MPRMSSSDVTPTRSIFSSSSSIRLNHDRMQPFTGSRPLIIAYRWQPRWRKLRALGGRTCPQNVNIHDTGVVSVGVIQTAWHPLHYLHAAAVNTTRVSAASEGPARRAELVHRGVVNWHLSKLLHNPKLLTGWRIVTPLHPTICSNTQIFRNPRWRTAAILKNVKYDISDIIWPIFMNFRYWFS